MRFRTTLMVLGLAALGAAQTTQLFTPEERDRVIQFWSDPNRYVVSAPDDVMDQGLWRVRLTVEGSTWIWNMNKGRKAAMIPTQDAKPQNDEQKTWEAWIAARVARDRWEALQVARSANQKIIGKGMLPPPDKTIPEAEPPQPGPIPAGLLASAGAPPKFAAAVVPMQHDVTFDDVKISYRDWYKPWNPRYAYFRFEKGVAFEGTPVKKISADRLDHLFKLADIGDSEAKVMRAVSMLEGGFDAINTYDTGYVSIGFIQFACLKDGGGSLGGMMLAYKGQNPDQYQKDFRNFGLDVTPDGKLAIIDPQTGGELYGADAARRIIEDKRLVAPFQRAGQVSEPFIAAQIRAAKSMYWPGDDPVSITVDGQTMTGKISDVVKSEAGLATLMDRKVNTGKIDPFTEVVNRIAAETKPKSLADLSKYEGEIVSQLKYRTNYLADASLSQPAAARSFSGASRGSQGRRGRSGGTKRRGR